MLTDLIARTDTILGMLAGSGNSYRRRDTNSDGLRLELLGLMTEIQHYLDRKKE